MPCADHDHRYLDGGTNQALPVLRGRFDVCLRFQSGPARRARMYWHAPLIEPEATTRLRRFVDFSKACRDRTRIIGGYVRYARVLSAGCDFLGSFCLSSPSHRAGSRLLVVGTPHQLAHGTDRVTARFVLFTRCGFLFFDFAIEGASLPHFLANRSLAPSRQHVATGRAAIACPTDGPFHQAAPVFATNQALGVLDSRQIGIEPDVSCRRSCQVIE